MTGLTAMVTSWQHVHCYYFVAVGVVILLVGVNVFIIA